MRQMLAPLAASLLCLGCSAQAQVMAPRALVDERAPANREVAVFAGGCFWGVEGVFSHVRGVIDAESGYSGGQASTAQYELTATGHTGHAESVRVTFDPRQVSYGDLLRIYFSVVADPTLKDRQGPDSGTQYRSALFPLSPAQQRVARAYIAQLEATKLFKRPIVTTVEPFRGFFRAEAEHQDFMARNPTYPYIVINDRPKVQALKAQFPNFWRA